MRYLVGGFLILSLAGAALGQVPGQSLGGFGSVIHPGLGSTPRTPPGGANGPYFFGTGRGGNFGNPVFADHPRHGRTVIVPYPVYYGPGFGYGYGYGYGGYGYDPTLGYPPQGYGDQGPLVNPNGAPSVVIYQNSGPPQQAVPQVRDYTSGDTGQDQQQSGMKLYQTPPTRPYGDSGQNAALARRAGTDDQATIYLIAFKDHTIVQALGYWMEGSTLHYVSTEHSLNQASIDLIDRDLSQRLNDERGVDFRLPPAR